MRFHPRPTRFCSPGLQDQHFPSIARHNLAQRPTWSYTVTANVSSARSDLIFWDHSIQCNLSDIHMSQKKLFSTIHNEWQHPSQKVGLVHSCSNMGVKQNCRYPPGTVVELFQNLAALPMSKPAMDRVNWPRGTWNSKRLLLVVWICNFYTFKYHVAVGSR